MWVKFRPIRFLKAHYELKMFKGVTQVQKNVLRST